MFFLKNALMRIKKVKLINHDRLPILMMFIIMLYVMFAYLMLLASLFNAFFAIDFCKYFLFSCFVLVY